MWASLLLCVYGERGLHSTLLWEVSMGVGVSAWYVLGERGLRGESMLTIVAMMPAGSGADLG